jgi:hypothetical protein
MFLKKLNSLAWKIILIFKAIKHETMFAISKIEIYGKCD